MNTQILNAFEVMRIEGSICSGNLVAYITKKIVEAKSLALQECGETGSVLLCESRGLCQPDPKESSVFSCPSWAW